MFSFWVVGVAVLLQCFRDVVVGVVILIFVVVLVVVVCVHVLASLLN